MTGCYGKKCFVQFYQQNPFRFRHVSQKFEHFVLFSSIVLCNIAKTKFTSAQQIPAFTALFFSAGADLFEQGGSGDRL